jgi:hypothetical protein
MRGAARCPGGGKKSIRVHLPHLLQIKKVPQFRTVAGSEAQESRCVPVAGKGPLPNRSFVAVVNFEGRIEQIRLPVRVHAAGQPFQQNVTFVFRRNLALFARFCTTLVPFFSLCCRQSHVGIALSPEQILPVKVTILKSYFGPILPQPQCRAAMGQPLAGGSANDGARSGKSDQRRLKSGSAVHFAEAASGFGWRGGKACGNVRPQFGRWAEEGMFEGMRSTARITLTTSAFRPISFRKDSSEVSCSGS